MRIHADFAEFSRLLAAQTVDFVIVGGYAAAFHGYVRTTQNPDLFCRNTPANVRRVLPALRRFGLPVTDVTVADFRQLSGRQCVRPVARMPRPRGNATGALLEAMHAHRVQG
jgi:hypothetical protein